MLNLRSGQALALQALSAAESGTPEAGGLIPYLKKRINRAQGHPA